jgi:hypothetical protein
MKNSSRANSVGDGFPWNDEQRLSYMVHDQSNPLLPDHCVTRDASQPAPKAKDPDEQKE